MPSKPKFKDNWLRELRFYWVGRVEHEEDRAECNLCGATLNALTHTLIRHMNNCGTHKERHNELVSTLKSSNNEITNDLMRLAAIAQFNNTKIAQISQDEKEKFVYYQCENSNDHDDMTKEENISNVEKENSEQLINQTVLDRFNLKLEQLKNNAEGTDSKFYQQLKRIIDEEDGINLKSDEEKGTNVKSAEEEGLNLKSAEEKGINLKSAKEEDINLKSGEDKGINLKFEERMDNEKKSESQEKKEYPDCIESITELTVRCNICERSFRRGKYNVRRHLNGRIHTENCKNQADFDPKVASAEIKLAASCALYNMSFSLTEKFTDVVKDTITDSEVTKNIKLGRKRVRDICVNVIAPAHKRRLTKIISEHKVSILVDESRDDTGTSYLCVNIRYKDRKRKKFVDSLWDIVPVYDDELRKANADVLFERIVNTFEEAQVDLKNIISFSSDGASVMVANDNSVYARFKKRLPNLIRAKCNCHISNLCTKDASKVLPKSIQKLNSSIRNYISKSAQRQNNWAELQKLLNLDPLTILQPHLIRWLSLYECTLRISRRWLALIFFFQVECEITKKRDKKEKDNCPFKILGMLMNPKIFGYFKFLEASLSKIMLFNKKFQTTKAIVPEDKPEIQNVYVYYLKRFMNPEYVDAEIESSSLSNINPEDETHFKPLEDVVLGRNAEIFIRSCKMSNSQKTEFRQNCRSFYIQLCKQIKQRFDFDNDHTLNFRYFHVKNARNHDFHQKFPDLNPVFQNFQSIIDVNDEKKKALINNEWKLLLNCPLPEELEKNWQKKNDHEGFWFFLLSYKNDDGQEVFSNLADFALDVIGIPNSNATPERTWSKMNLEKTKQRCQLKYPSLRAILLSSQYVKDVGGIKFFEPTDEMIKRMKSPIYSVSKKKTKTKNGTDKEKKPYVEYLGRRIKDALMVAAAMEDKRYKKPHTELLNVKDDDPENNDFLRHYLHDIQTEEDKDESIEDTFCAELLEHYKECNDDCEKSDVEDDGEDEDEDDDDDDEDDDNDDDDDDEEDAENTMEAVMEDYMIFIPKNTTINEHSYSSRRERKHLKRKTTTDQDLEISEKKMKLDDFEDETTKIEKSDNQIQNIDCIISPENKSLLQNGFDDISGKKVEWERNKEDTTRILKGENEILNILSTANKTLSKIFFARSSEANLNISKITEQNKNITESKLSIEKKFNIVISPMNFEKHSYFINGLDSHTECLLPNIRSKFVNIELLSENLKIEVYNTCPIDSLAELVIHSIKKEKIFEQLYYKYLSSKDPKNIFPILFKYTDITNSNKKKVFSPCNVNIFYYERVKLMILIKNNEKAVFDRKELDCEHSISNLCAEILRSSANNFRERKCSNCPYSESTKLPVLDINTINIINDGIGSINREILFALENKQNQYCTICTHPSVTISYTIGNFMIVDCEDCYRPDVRKMLKVKKRLIKPKLCEIPREITIQNNVYRLSGFVAFEGQGLTHYFCINFLEKDKWIKIDDLYRPHETVISDDKHTQAYNIAIILYIRDH